ncbi:MAG: DUF808 domain-containing protein [Betaproteobacteria bacterium HGW-Betaproteobacteria-22]|nr:MAG: DUF808 domain-containing protein [Betaproteobacteria bacterium HGW-Betaproteobacteria-22]
MAGTSLLTLIDDIATILDDVSVMTKVAAKKTAGVLGDDLALNAQQVTGVNADRELPVVWAVAKGSMVNKLILVPLALIISALLPWAITPLLVLGGLFLCFEGVEKLFHKWFHITAAQAHSPQHKIGDDEHNTLKMHEKEKIKGAIRTDFVLSAEIIVITLGTVASAGFSQQVAVLISIAAIMTVGVYGLVAGIVKLDDGGIYLTKCKGGGMTAKFKRQLGLMILGFAPYMMRSLSIVGTAAMFLVGGGILAHGSPTLHQLIERASNSLSGGFLQAITPGLLNGLLGIAAGIATLTFALATKKLLAQFKTK